MFQHWKQQTAQALASSASLISLALPGLSSEISMEQLFSIDWVTMAADRWEQEASSLLGPHCPLQCECAVHSWQGPGQSPARRAAVEHEAAAACGGGTSLPS